MGWNSVGAQGPRPLAPAGKVEFLLYVASQETRRVGWECRSGRGTAPYAPLRVLHGPERLGRVGVTPFVGNFLRTYRKPYP